MDLKSNRNLCDLDSGNPLLQKLPRELSLMEWGEKLFSDPRQNWEKPYPFPPLESHFEALRDLFIPTQVAIEIASAMHTMMLASLRARDPRIAENRKAIYRDSDTASGEEISQRLSKTLNFSNAARGMMIQGPTGNAKTHIIDNFVRHFPQTVRHGPNESYGWSMLHQLVYLQVEIPNDARESSLYHAIADALDVALGTRYGVEVRRRDVKVPDKLALILQWLRLHRCGLLILDELQDKQTSPVVLGKEFAGAFLKIMNAPIPLVVVGNPLAFEHIMDFTQDVGRLTTAGCFDMIPPFDSSDPSWALDLVPGIWGWTCFNEKDPKISGLEKILFERTGGVPKFLAIYRIASLKEALRAGATRVEKEHMDRAYFSREMTRLHPIVEAYVEKDAAKFENMRDQPVLFLKDAWALEDRRRKFLAMAT